MTFQKYQWVFALSLAAMGQAAVAENVRIAFIDPLSGPFAPVGANVLKSYQAIAELANKGKWAGENTIEVVGFDNKGSPQESLTQFKAARDADLTASFYTVNAATSGVPTAMGAGGADRVKNIAYWNPNNESFSGHEIVDEFKKKYNDDYYGMATYSTIALLSKAIKETRSAEPVKVALAMEGMKVKSLNGEIEMRKADHQLQQPLYIATWSKINGKDVRYDQENTGYGWKTDQKIDPYVASQPTSCQMKRPV